MFPHTTHIETVVSLTLECPASCEGQLCLDAHAVAEPRPAATVVVIRTWPPRRSRCCSSVATTRSRSWRARMFFQEGGSTRSIEPCGGRRGSSRRGEAPSRFTDLSRAEELPYRVAAVREIAGGSSGPSHGRCVDSDSALGHAGNRDPSLRHAVLLAQMPDGQIARHDDGEMTALVWLPAAEAIDQCRRGEMMLPPPTWTTLKQLARFDIVDEALAWARTKPIARVEPGFIKTAEKTMLTLPGDPLHPTVPAWDVPEDTRFVLEEGKGWRPVPVS